MKKIIYFLGFLLLLASCSQTADKKAKLEKLRKERDALTAQIVQLEKDLQPEGTATVVPVLVQPVEKQPFNHYIEVQGRVDGNENIGVSPRTAGVINKILVKEGDHVTNGQILAELDAEVLKQSLNELKSQLAFATDLYQKQKNLWDQQIGSEVQYLTAKNNMESLQNKIATIRDQISMSNITSPIDGTVEEIQAKVGQMASPGVPAFRVVNFAKTKAVADVGEAYTAKIKTGDQVKIFLPDLNKEFERTVTFASKYINPTNRTFVVEAELPATDNVYRANMIAVVRIKDYHNPDAIAIPQNFIQTSRDEGTFVFIASEKDGKKFAHKAPVKPGVSYNGLTEILQGLDTGDLVITAGYKDLYEGQQISY
jgi:membrane fusion protein (multidrug efflux system)